MATNLVISNKLISLRGKMNITDQSGQLMYDAIGEFALLSPTWRINKGHEQIATVRRKILSFVPTWNIKGAIGDFAIKRKIFSFTRKYNVLGGPFDGAVLSGNIWDLKFNITNGSENIARATGKIFTLRDCHNIEVTKSGKEAELMTVIAMVTLRLDRKSKNNAISFNDND